MSCCLSSVSAGEMKRECLLRQGSTTSQRCTPGNALTFSFLWLTSSSERFDTSVVYVVDRQIRDAVFSGCHRYGKDAFATGSIALSQIDKGLASYQALGVPPSDIVVALPWFGSEYMCDCADPWYPSSGSETGNDPKHNGGPPECPSTAPWNGNCPKGCRLNRNKPTPRGPGPDLGVSTIHVIDTLPCCSKLRVLA